jgi:hypothetical protein
MLKARSEVLSGTFKFIVSASMSHNLAGKGLSSIHKKRYFSFEIYKRCLLGVISKALWLQFDYPMEQCLIFLRFQKTHLSYYWGCYVYIKWSCRTAISRKVNNLFICRSLCSNKSVCIV